MKLEILEYANTLFIKSSKDATSEDELRGHPYLVFEGHVWHEAVQYFKVKYNIDCFRAYSNTTDGITYINLLVNEPINVSTLPNVNNILICTHYCFEDDESRLRIRIPVTDLL